MPINFNQLQPINQPPTIQQLPETQSESTLGRIGKALSGLGGIVGATSGATANATGQMNPVMNNSYGMQSANIPGLQQGQPNTLTGNAFRAPGDRTGAMLGGNPDVMKLANQYLGLQEGTNAPALNAFFQKSLGQNVDPKSIPWCGAFAGSVLKQSGQQAPNNPLMARSYLNFGQPTNKPAIGDLVILNRNNDGVSGHVGFFNGINEQGQPTILAGNQGNAVSIKPYNPANVLGYRTVPPVKEIQSKPSPQVMTQQAVTRMQHDPQYAHQVSQQMTMINPNNHTQLAMSNVAKPFSIPSVVEAAQNIYKENPVMAGIAASQAILESNLTEKPSKLAQNNNLFGIKGQGTAGSVNMPTKEYNKGKSYKTNADFAKNASLEDSYQQHKNLMEKGIKKNPKLYEKVMQASSVEEAAKELQKAGYATDPTYAKQIKAIYEKYVKPNLKLTLGGPEDGIIPGYMPLRPKPHPINPQNPLQGPKSAPGSTIAQSGSPLQGGVNWDQFLA